MKKIMQVIGTLFIVFALADFGLSYMGMNLTPFLSQMAYQDLVQLYLD